MKTVKLVDLAKTIRSKNAGTDKITFDIIFREKENYDLVKSSGVLTRRTVATLFTIPEERISDFQEFDPAYAIKFTIYRASRAAARATATSSAASSTRRSWKSKSR